MLIKTIPENWIQRFTAGVAHPEKKGIIMASRNFALGVAIALLAFNGSTVRSQGLLPLQIATNGSRVELSWPARWSVPAGVKITATHEVQRSYDLRIWETIASQIAGGTGAAGDRLTFPTEQQGPQAFYRLGTIVNLAEFSANEMTGAEVYGYADEFNQVLKGLGQISPEQFAALYPAPTNYLAQLTWDPTQAPYAQSNRLAGVELAFFKTNGFVVSEGLGAPSCGEIYYRIFSGDLPVFITTDSILQAWHRSYIGLLEELEAVYLSRSLEKMLDGMAAQIPAAWQQAGNGVLADSIRDADYYLAVARTLLAGTNRTTYLSQDTRVAATIQAINNLATTNIYLFGTNREVDFSQFKVRGHYERSAQLARYFRAMMWCGRIDMRVAGNPDLSSLRELGTAMVLGDLLNKAGQFDAWRQFDQVLEVFVGWTDSMNFGQLADLVTAANIHSLTDITSLDVLRQLQWDIVTGQKGFQNIRGEFYDTPLSSERMQLPYAFTVLGQKFVLDSWVFSQVVYDSIRWDKPGDLIVLGKVDRRIPSALDTAFAVFGNNQIAPELYSRMTNSHGRKFRDGLPYQHNLAAVRNVIDHQNATAWDQNIYMGWLAALRSLSEPTTDSRYPECMRTRAWALKTLNTQLASWTQLRHDTILYAKQSYTAPILCSYPAGFVEPRLEFWQRMQTMASNAANLISRLTFEGTITVQVTNDFLPAPYEVTVNLPTLQSNYVAFLQQFADRMATLRGITEKELAQLPLTTHETAFIKSLMEDWSYLEYGGYTTYSGWYPNLFYINVFDQSDTITGRTHGAGKWDPLVVDVHTDTPDMVFGDPGCVLHEAVGNAHLLVVAVDNGADRMVYAGPVLSHYEFEMPVDVRKTDTEWKMDIQNGKASPHPEWTKSFLVPGYYYAPPDWLQ